MGLQHVFELRLLEQKIHDHSPQARILELQFLDTRGPLLLREAISRPRLATLDLLGRLGRGPSAAPAMICHHADTKCACDIALQSAFGGHLVGLAELGNDFRG